MPVVPIPRGGPKRKLGARPSAPQRPRQDHAPATTRQGVVPTSLQRMPRLGSPGAAQVRDDACTRSNELDLFPYGTRDTGFGAGVSNADEESSERDRHSKHRTNRRTRTDVSSKGKKRQPSGHAAADVPSEQRHASTKQRGGGRGAAQRRASTRRLPGHAEVVWFATLQATPESGVLEKHPAWVWKRPRLPPATTTHLLANRVGSKPLGRLCAT